LSQLLNIGPISAQNRRFAHLKNIGKKIAGGLNEVGIFSEDDLKQVDAIGVSYELNHSLESAICPSII
jgi:hypothetical protein